MEVNPRVVFLLGVIVIASAGMGVSYANGGVEDSDEIVYDVAFSSVSCSDNEDSVDVGEVSAEIVDGGDSISVSVSNAYPGYVADIDYTVVNLGDKPVTYLGVTAEEYDTALDIDVSSEEPGFVLGVGEEMSGTLTVTVLQLAQQGSVYSFSVDLGFESDECGG